MSRFRPWIVSLAITLCLGSATSFAQTSGVMRFDGGGDGSSWNQADNWEHVNEPDGTPTTGNPPTPPTNQYTANIGQAGVVLSNAMPGQAAFRVRVGVTTPGTFNMTGGSLNITDDLTLGQSAQGTMTLSDGTLTVGDDFFIDDAGAFGSSFTMNGGTLHMVDRIVMGNQGHITINGGHIIAEDDFFFFGTSTQTINGGLLEQFDKLSNGPATPAGPARLKINGGTVRTNEWTDNSDLTAMDPTRFMSVIEVNGPGRLQIEADNFSESVAQTLIANGRLTTTGGSSLKVSTVVVPEFFGRSNVAFTQISGVPEPGSALLAAMAGAAVALRRRRS